MLSSFGIITLDSRKCSKINLYSNNTEDKLQALTFAAITSVCITVQRETLEGGNLANQAKYHCWRNKIWRIVSKVHVLFNWLAY